MASHILRANREDSGARLDAFLNRHVESMSRRQAKLTIQHGAVFVDGRQVRKPSHPVVSGAKIEIDSGFHDALCANRETTEGLVIYEDRYLIVVDKPAGVVVQSPHDYDRSSLVDRIQSRIMHQSRKRRPAYVGLIHLLDRETSGIMVLSKARIVNRSLSQQFQTNSIEREFLALVYGPFEKPSGVRTSRLAWSPSNQRVVTSERGGKPAITEYRVVDSAGDLSLVELRPRTLHTHQLRVHLADLGHPIVGDPLYMAPVPVTAGDSEARPPLPRKALHASKLGFIHPVSSKRMIFDSKLPADIRSALTRPGNKKSQVPPASDKSHP